MPGTSTVSEGSPTRLAKKKRAADHDRGQRKAQPDASRCGQPADHPGIVVSLLPQTCMLYTTLLPSDLAILVYPNYKSARKVKKTDAVQTVYPSRYALRQAAC
jgi:hypothetical protein